MSDSSLRKAAREMLYILDSDRWVNNYYENWLRAREALRAALAAPTPEPSRENDYAGSMTTCEIRGPRLVGPHGGIRGNLPNPTDADLADPLFEAIWQATKTWDVNAPEYYVGYCGMNGSHVMLIVNAIRAMESEPNREVTQEQAQWQPIETVPKETEVLVGRWVNDEWRICQSGYYFDPGSEYTGEPSYWYWHCDNDAGGVTDDHPDAWMPLPKPAMRNDEGKEPAK